MTLPAATISFPVKDPKTLPVADSPGTGDEITEKSFAFIARPFETGYLADMIHNLLKGKEYVGSKGTPGSPSK